MGLIKKIAKGAVIFAATGIIVGAFVYGLKNLKESIGYEEEKDMVTQILDTNRDRKLSQEEMQVFFDNIGLEPYANSLNSVLKKDIRVFLDNYTPK